MNRLRMLFPAIGMFAIFGLVGFKLGTLEAQSSPQAAPAVVLGDLSSAAIVQIRDPQGQVVLQGQFDRDEEGDESEREAKLAATGVDADAEGKAEADVSRPGRPVEQELEVEVDKLSPNTRFLVVIDSREIAAITTDARGHAEQEWKSVPASASQR
jgi:hypothetical protein